MKSNFHYIIVLLFLNTICLSHMAFGQIVGNDIFLKGKYVEIGICKVGAFGSDETAPEGYHPRAGTGCSNFCLGFVADPDMDGFEVGAPAYIGDFFVPGTPQEGWDIQIGLDRIGGWRGYTGTAFTSISGGSGILDGGNVGIDTVGSEVQAIWEGAHLTSGLIIKKKTILDTNKVFFIVEVTLENPTGETIDSIYYNRTVDADNIAAMRPVPGPWIYDDFQTDNRIDMQPDATDNRALVSCVTSALLSYVDVSTYLGLASDDCRATVYIIDDDLFPRPGFFGDGDSLNLITLSNRTWPDFLFDVGLGGYADVGVGIVFNIGAIEPGGKAVFSYAYILRAADIDSAFIKLKPKWNLDIGALGSSDTIEACVGSVLEVNLSAHSGYTWSTWLPTDGLDTPVGLPNRITVGVDTITYRLVGTSLVCPTNDTMVLTVIPIIQPPPGADSFGTVCLGSSGIDLYDYLSEGTILGGVFNGAG